LLASCWMGLSAFHFRTNSNYGTITAVFDFYAVALLFAGSLWIGLDC